MKRYFITGLVIFLPVALTLAVVTFIFNFLTEPFVGVVKSVLVHFDLLEQGFLFLSPDRIQELISQFIILTMLFFFTVGLGWLGRWFFFHYLIRLWESFLNQIPVVRGVYKVCQDVIKTIFVSKNRSFKQVVMVPFPNADTQSIGLLTCENLPMSLDEHHSLVAVFVPTTPNPTSGFLMLFKREDIIYLDMKVEDAFKLIISCGVITAPIRRLSTVEMVEA